MPQTEFWRGVQIALPNFDPANWWQRRRSVWIPPIILVSGLLALMCVALWAVSQYDHHRAELQAAARCAARRSPSGMRAKWPTKRASVGATSGRWRVAPRLANEA